MYIETTRDLIDAINKYNLRYFYVSYGGWEGKVIAITDDTVVVATDEDEQHVIVYNDRHQPEIYIDFEKAEEIPLSADKLTVDTARNLCRYCKYFKCPKKCEAKEFIEKLFTQELYNIKLDKKVITY